MAHFVQKLFSLDTLDTRFTASAKPSQSIPLQPDPVKPSPTADSDGNLRANGVVPSQKKKDSVPPPKWRTPEFYFYWLFIAVSLPLMFKAGFEVSKRKCFCGTCTWKM